MIKIKISTYILGLWLGDKYWWGSSIGLTNTDLRLIKKFREFFRQCGLEERRIKLSVYTKNEESINKEELSKLLEIPSENIKMYKFKKGQQTYFIIYVNSRKLKREFEALSQNLEDVIKDENTLLSYIAGRFDSDGYYSAKRNEIRISYTTKKEAEKDASLIMKFFLKKPRVKFERQANTWNVELTGKKWSDFIKKVLILSERTALLQSHRQLVP